MMDVIDRYAAAIGIGLVGLIASIVTVLAADETAAIGVFRFFLSLAYLWLFGNVVYDFIITPIARSIRKNQSA